MFQTQFLRVNYIQVSVLCHVSVFVGRAVSQETDSV